MHLRLSGSIRGLSALALAAAALPSFGIIATATNATPEDATFTSVGRFDDAATGLLGSGVVVGPHQILTARHVVYAANYATATFSLGGETYQPTAISVAPDFLLSNGNAVSIDLALVTVDKTFDDFYKVGPAPKVGSTIAMVGYGQDGRVDGSGNYYSPGAAGTRRKGENTIDFVDRVFAGLGPSLISYLDRAGEAALGSRDSGGGWFQNGRLVGISSFVLNDAAPGSDPAKYANYGFASANLTGFDSQADAPNYTGTPYTLPAGSSYFASGAIDLTNPQVGKWLRANGVAPVPEPASMLVLGLGAAATLRRRRRRLP